MKSCLIVIFIVIFIVLVLVFHKATKPIILILITPSVRTLRQLFILRYNASCSKPFKCFSVCGRLLLV
jgi:hypothetical protein